MGRQAAEASIPRKSRARANRRQVTPFAYLTLSAATVSRNRAIPQVRPDRRWRPWALLGYNEHPASPSPASPADVDLTYHATSAGLYLRASFAAAIACSASAFVASRSAVAEEPAAAAEPAAVEAELSPRPTMENAIGPFVQAYCIDCHSGDSAEAGLDFDKLLAAPSVPHRRLQWQRAVERVAAGEMPPPDMTQPESKERDAALAWLREELADPDLSLIHI